MVEMNKAETIGKVIITFYKVKTFTEIASFTSL